MAADHIGDVAPPKPVERVLRASAYFLICASGLWSLAVPPGHTGTTLPSTLGSCLTVIWSLFILTSLPAAIVTLLGRYRVEYSLIPWFSGALFMAVVYEWWKVSLGSEIVPHALFNSTLVFLLTVRFVTLHQLVRVKPKGETWTRTLSK
jgi:hypothetical protein